MATIADAFDGDYDAIKLLNHNVVPDLGPQVSWVFRDPSQLRPVLARFDPRNFGSPDLLAGGAGLFGLGMMTPWNNQDR